MLTIHTKSSEGAWDWSLEICSRRTAILTSMALPQASPVKGVSIDVASFGTIQNAGQSYYLRVRDDSNGFTPFYLSGNGNLGLGGNINPTSGKLQIMNANQDAIYVVTEPGGSRSLALHHKGSGAIIDSYIWINNGWVPAFVVGNSGNMQVRNDVSIGNELTVGKLAGSSSNAYVCADPNGKLFKSMTPCV